MHPQASSASELVVEHGRRAYQLVIDQIVRAVARDDDDAADEWDALLVEVERELSRSNRAVMFGKPDLPR